MGIYRRSRLTCFCFLVNFVAGCLELGKEIDHGLFQNIMVSALDQTKLCHHPPPSTTNHHQPKYIHHHPPSPTTSQNIFTTTHHQPKYIHQRPPRPTNSQNLFYEKPIYKNLQPLSGGNVRKLNSRPAISKKLFFRWPSPFLLHTPEMVLRSCSVNKPLYYAKLVQF